MSDLRFLFVGEKPSNKAFTSGWTWKSGRLAANTLFRALRACSIDPEAQDSVEFMNLFGDEPDVPEHPTDDRLAAILRFGAAGWTVVAMGSKVDKALQRHNVAHKTIVHPAARGTIRAEAVYNHHVSSMLLNT